MIQCSDGQTMANTCESANRVASHSPKRGPTSITANATTSSPRLIAASRIASNRVFQNGRVSFTSYAISSASMVASKAEEITQIVPNIPNESQAPRCDDNTSAKTEYTARIASRGNNFPRNTSTYPNRSGRGMKATQAERTTRAGKIDSPK